MAGLRIAAYCCVCLRIAAWFLFVLSSVLLSLLQTNWPLSLANWEDIEQRAWQRENSTSIDTTGLPDPLRELLLGHRAEQAALLTLLMRCSPRAKRRGR